MRIVHEVDDELGEYGIERSVSPRKLLGSGLANIRPRHALRAGGDKRLRGVRGAHELRSDSLCKPLGQGAGAGSDVKHAHPGLDAGELDQPRRARVKSAP